MPITLYTHYPFGSTLPTRSWSDASRAYRYGFNGKEKDSETANDNYDFGARIYDGRLGRWLSTDPLQTKYPDVSPYSYCFNNPLHFTDENGKWVRDQNGNVIVTLDNTLDSKYGSNFTIGNNYQTYSVAGNWGYIMSNNGTKVEVFIPTSNTVIKTTYDAMGNVTGTSDVTASCDGETNCTSNSLLPTTSNIIISSNQITSDILKSEGFVNGAEIEKNAQDLANSGDKAAQDFSIDKITQQGDIVVYGDPDPPSPLVYSTPSQVEHFEYFVNSTTVDTKGGVQKGPVLVAPGQNKNFSDPQTWINTNVGGWQDPKVTTTGGTTANGQTTIDKEQFNKIHNDVKAKNP